ncbi:hypothetical protein DIE06_10190 [Burkholderia sp. Bp8998]|nr:hypothetical protein DIE06_10190 [Burkholderia sp. Bp8998]
MPRGVIGLRPSGQRPFRRASALPVAKFSVHLILFRVRVESSGSLVPQGWARSGYIEIQNSACDLIECA